MTVLRTKIPDFELANPLYTGAQVSFFGVDEDGVSTGVLATLYSAPTGAGTLTNPQTLDADGKFEAAVYIEDPVIGAVTGANVPSHSTGVIAPFRGRWRGDWVTATVYRENDFIQDALTNNIYVATEDYTSGATLAADVAASDLALVFSFTAITADAAQLVAALAASSASAAAALVSQLAAAASATAADASATTATSPTIGPRSATTSTPTRS